MQREKDNGLVRRTNDLMTNVQQTMETVFAHCCNGGNLIDLCEVWQVKYATICRWIYDDAARKKVYEDALQAQTEWAVRRILKEIQDIGFADPRDAFDEHGNLKDIKTLPQALANTIQSVEVMEEYQGRGKDREFVGYTKKIKFWDKMKALELLGKQLKLFVERKEISGKLTLEGLVMSSLEPEKVIEVTPEPPDPATLLPQPQKAEEEDPL